VFFNRKGAAIVASQTCQVFGATGLSITILTTLLTPIQMVLLDIRNHLGRQINIADLGLSLYSCGRTGKHIIDKDTFAILRKHSFLNLRTGNPATDDKSNIQR